MTLEEIATLGGAGRTAAFDPSIFDRTFHATKRPSVLLRKRGKTLSFDDFATGTSQGFNPNMGGYDQINTTLAPSTGFPFSGKYTLCLATGENHYTKDENTRTSSAVKRMALVKDATEWDTISISLIVALVGTGVPPVGVDGYDANRPYKYPWRRFYIGLDMQEPTASDGRRFPVLQLLDRSTANLYQSPAWQIIKDRYDTANNKLDPAPDPITLAGSGDLFSGLNEFKGGPFTYVRLTWSRTTGYVEAQINDQTFDLRSLGGQMARDKHLNTSSLDKFSYGLNAIFGLERSSQNPDFTQNRAYVDHCWVTVGDDLRLAA
ncbi:hypothetical protein HR12_20890 [Microbacterium sp. SUBG005]|nr:hypothetical protein HR12_20890 [Microbacterium sp. SUBG005]